MPEATDRTLLKKSSPPRAFSLLSARAREKRRGGWEVVRGIARRHLNLFVSLEKKVLQGEDPKAIHDFRVASRRLQQALDLLYPKPRSKKVRKLRDVIRRSRGTFSEARNCDVLLERVDRYLAQKRSGQRETPRETWISFREFLEKRRAEAFRASVGKLIRMNLSDFYVRLRDSLSSPPQAVEGSLSGNGAEAEASPEGEPFESRLIRELQTTWDHFEAQVQHSQNEGETNSLHPVRIAAKQLRYLVELMVQLHVPGSQKVVSRLKRLQQHLGNWHDLEVMEEMMAEMLSRPKFLRGHIDLAIRIEKLMLRNRKDKGIYQKKYFAVAFQTGGCSEMKAWVNDFTTSAPPAGAET